MFGPRRGNRLPKLPVNVLVSISLIPAERLRSWQGTDNEAQQGRTSEKRASMQDLRHSPFRCSREISCTR